MSLVSEIGDSVLGEVHAEWKIRDFFSLSNKVDDFYNSPVFGFDDEQWFLSLYPNGQTGYSSTGSLGLYIHRKVSGPHKTVYFTFGIKDSDGVEKKEELEVKFSPKNNAWGIPKFWSRSELRKRKSTLVPNNILTVTCILRCSAPSSVKGEEKVLKSLRNMLESGDDSDVVIKIQGKEFPAHRGILRARSPVFRSMFAHDMVEKQSNVITIEDGDPETFQNFLVHIYSGSCEQISTKNVFSLYTAADKYDVGELKVECSKFMKRNITVACFCDVIMLAVKHNDKDLIECATNFFCDNTVNIAKTAEWQTFLKDNSTVGNELFIKAVSK